MKKVIVTRENYEEVMFDLLEDVYTPEVRENILDQIHADTLLNFEWQQWSKAVYSESTEIYKAAEAEFIEGLTKEAEKKKGWIVYWRPLAAAAVVILAVGVYLLFNADKELNPGIVSSAKTPVLKELAQPEKKEAIQAPLPSQAENKVSALPQKQANPEIESPVSRVPDAWIKPEKTEVVMENGTPVEQAVIPTFSDTIRHMIASATKHNRYKITISEERSGDLPEDDYDYKEKRYSMADVLNRKDGISLSKFLQNPNSRIVTDKQTNKITIEYIAQDHSVLVLTLSN